MALTTCVMPACTAACDGQACVPMNGVSRGRSANGRTISSETFWSLALYDSILNPSEFNGSQNILLNSLDFWLRREPIEYSLFCCAIILEQVVSENDMRSNQQGV